MLSVWTRHITDPDQKARFEQELINSNVLDRLRELLKQAELELDVSERSVKAYDNPNWAYRQAHANGIRQGFSKIKSLLTFDKKETNDRQPIRPPGQPNTVNIELS